MADPKYLAIELDSIPTLPDGRAACDLYVHMPSSNRYVRFVVSGDSIDAARIESIRLHPVPKLYKMDADTTGPVAHIPDPEIPADFQQAILGKVLEGSLKDAYKVLSADADPGEAVKFFEGMSDQLVSTIAPDVKSLSDHLKKQSQYLHLMSDAAALSTLSVICAFANGFDSRKSYRELSYATLVMDISLAEFSVNDLRQWYTDRDKIEGEKLKKMMLHPMTSYQLAEQKLKSLSDVTMQLILNHHELYNGKGFPRGIRTEALFPIARILSLAVDTFERLKKSHLSGNRRSLVEILIDLRDETQEAHLRRHNRKIIDQVIEFLAPGTNAMATAAKS